MDEIFKGNPKRYKKVKVIIPESYHLTLEVKGQTMAFTHGHMTSGSGNAENKIEQWWKGQMYGWLPVGQASILVTAHYHHFRAKTQGDRHWFQCPSLDKSIDFTNEVLELFNERTKSMKIIITSSK